MNGIETIGVAIIVLITIYGAIMTRGLIATYRVLKEIKSSLNGD